MSDIRKRLGRRIRSLRANLDLSQEELAVNRRAYFSEFCPTGGQPGHGIH